MKVATGTLGWATSDNTTTESNYAASGDISSATLYGRPFRCDGMEMIAIQIVLTGATVTGTVKLQASCDAPDILQGSDLPNASAMNWTDVDGATYTATVAAKPMFDVSATGARWLRLVWTESGTAAGAIASRVNAKGPH